MTTAEALAAIKVRHHQKLCRDNEASYVYDGCAVDRQDWPCDAARLAAVVEAALALPAPFPPMSRHCAWCGRKVHDDGRYPPFGSEPHYADCPWQAVQRALGGLGATDTDTPRSERETGRGGEGTNAS